MRLPHQKSNRAEPPRPPVLAIIRAGRLLILVLAAGLAWVYPDAKPDAVLGRLNYWQFWLAVAVTGLALFALVLHFLPLRWRRPFGFRAAAIILSLLVVLAMGELLGWFLPVRHQMDNPWYFAAGGGISDSVELPFERPPHLKWEGMSRGDLALLNGDADPYARTITFETDSEGFRNSRDLAQADLVFIGDSFTEAGNVLETESFVALAGQRLGLTTRNLGRAGYTAATELIVLKKFGLPCRPRIVVWQIAESNDLTEMRIYQDWIAHGRPRYFDTQPPSVRREAWQRRSPTFRLFVALRQITPRPWPLAGTFRDETGVEHPIRFLSAPGLQPPVRTHEAWPAFSQTLLEGAELCQSNHIQLLVLLLPMKSRVLGPYTKLAEPATGAFSRAESDSLGAVLKEFCGAHHIPFADATHALQGQAKAGRLVYQPFDTHLSPLGHQVVAELIATRLSSP